MQTEQALLLDNLGNLIDRARKMNFLSTVASFLSNEKDLMEAFGFVPGFIYSAEATVVDDVETSKTTEYEEDTVADVYADPVEGVVGLAVEVAGKQLSLSQPAVPASAAKTSLIQPILPHEILLMIMGYLKEGKSLMNWITALVEEKYPSLGELRLFAGIGSRLGLNDKYIWPALWAWKVDKRRRSVENGQLVARLAHFFSEMDFREMWPLDLVSVATDSPMVLSCVNVTLLLRDTTMAILDLLAACDRITSLTLEGSKCSHIKSDFSIKLISALSSISNLGDLNFRDFPFNSLFLDILYGSFKNFSSSLKILRLESNGSCDLRIAELAKVLPGSPIQSLTLDSFPLSIQNCAVFSECLATSNLKSLSIENLDFEEEDEEAIMHFLTDGLVNSQIQDVYFCRPFYDEETFNYMIENLWRMNCLKNFQSSSMVSFRNAPFYLKCVLKTKADVSLVFIDDDEEFDPGFYPEEYNLQDLAQKYERYKASFNRDDREFFHAIFPHDDT